MGDELAPATFSTLFDRWAWRPIPHCPGRYVLADGPIATAPEDMAAGAHSSMMDAVATDPVLVTPF